MIVAQCKCRDSDVKVEVNTHCTDNTTVCTWWHGTW